MGVFNCGVYVLKLGSFLKVGSLYIKCFDVAECIYQVF